MSTEYCLAYVTTGSREEAESLAEAIIGERLAACANILGTITSVYRWQEKVEKGEEVSLIFKTKSTLIRELTVRVGELHSYDCPCVVSLPIQDGNAAFLSWIGEETRAPR